MERIRMNPLRSTVTERGGWLEIRLLDFNITADGASESEMLTNIRNAIIDEYRLAMAHHRLPFVDIRAKCAKADDQRWHDDGKKLKSLGLPDEVCMALSFALNPGAGAIMDFGIKDVA